MRDKFIQVFENVFDKEFCKSVIDLYESENQEVKQCGKVGVKVGSLDQDKSLDKEELDNLSLIKSSKDMVIPFPEHPHLDAYKNKDDWTQIFEAFAEAAGHSMIEYNKRLQAEDLDKFCPYRDNFIIKALNSPRQITAPQIQKSVAGDYFSWHSDYVPGKDRLFAMLFYLNDVDEDAEGTTEFLNDVHVRPKAGKLVMFPADWRTLHRGNVLKHGSKYLVSMFTTYDDNTSELELERDELKFERDDLLDRMKAMQNELDKYKKNKFTTATDYKKFDDIVKDISDDEPEEELSAEAMVDPIRDHGPER
tara:strand:+ start:1517 stop:2437 length:921 start_codon:yes stop_codon:yes gene_type:complete